MFHFSLQSLLDYRKHIVDQLLSELAEARRLFNEAEITLKKLKAEKQATASTLDRLQEGSLNATVLASYISYTTLLQNRINEQDRTVQDVSKRLEEKQHQVTEAVKQRKVLEILREKRYGMYLQETMKRERKELDELGILRTGKGGYLEKTDHSL